MSVEQHQQALIKAIKSACDDAEDMRFRESYSGRGMFGRTCVSVVGCMQSFQQMMFTVLAESASELQDTTIDGTEEEAAEAFSQHMSFIQHITDFKMDSMGLDTIFYWEDLEVNPE